MVVCYLGCLCYFCIFGANWATCATSVHLWLFLHAYAIYVLFGLVALSVLFLGFLCYFCAVPVVSLFASLNAILKLFALVLRVVHSTAFAY